MNYDPNLDPDKEMKVRIISAVLANCTVNGTQININLTLALEMLDKLLTEFQITVARRKN